MLRQKPKSTLLGTTTLQTTIPKFVLTGGPCGGKTTALQYLGEKLQDYGWTVFIVPEIPTEFILNGAGPGKSGLTRGQFQEYVFNEVLRRETLYNNMAHRSMALKKIIICDRGLMDGLAYSDKKEFEFHLDRRGLNTIRARDEQYNAVFHLQTAAIGAEEFYTLDNNTARYETLEEAKIKDALILKAWTGHPHLRIIDNSTDFEGKLRRLLAEVCHALGIPVPLEIERKFLVEQPDIKHFPGPVQRIRIEQAYLISNDKKTERRVRKREQDGAYMFLETRKQKIRPLVRAETEWQISESQFLRSLVYDRDPTRAIITKDRFCFPYKSQYFELDCFIEPHKGLWVLELELTQEQQEIDLPPFIKIVREVTNDLAFTNSELARIT